MSIQLKLSLLLLLLCETLMFAQKEAYKTRFLEKGVDAAYLIGADPIDSTIYIREYDDNFNGDFLSIYRHGKYKRLTNHSMVIYDHITHGVWGSYDKKLVHFEKNKISEEYQVTAHSISPCSSGGCIALTGNKVIYLNQNKITEFHDTLQVTTCEKADYILSASSDQFYLITNNRVIFLCDPLHHKKPVEIKNIPAGPYRLLDHSKSIIFFKTGKQAGWIDHEKVVVIDTLLYPSFKNPNSFHADGNGRIFVLSRNELLIYENGTFSKYNFFWPQSGEVAIVDCMKGTDEIIYLQNGTIFRYSKTLKQFYIVQQMGWISMYFTSGLVWGDSLLVFSRSYPFFEMNLKDCPPIIPDVKIKSFTYEGKTIQPKQHVTIPFQDYFLIHYGVIEKENQKNVSYQIRILGMGDTAWYETNREVEELFFPSYGDYSFEVRANCQSGVWGKPIRMDFTILPPWYRSGWAYGGYSLVLIAFILGLLQWRTVALRKEKTKLEETIKQRTAEVVQQKEEAERQKQIAEKSAKIKQDFLSNMSHEIRTPLNAISGYTELSLQEMLPDKVKNNLQAVKLSSFHLKKLVDDILDISQLESGTINFYPSHFDFTQLIEEIKTMMHFKIREKNNVLNSTITYTTSPFLFGDKDKLMQVMINLLDNAAKFTENGKVDIQAEVKDRPGNQVLVSVKISDTGIGIHPEKRASIFESFVQADNSISRKYGGNGLGLSISKKIIELQGGEIVVESEENKGSTFSFYLHFLKGTNNSPPAPLPVYGNLHGLSILAAEDDPVNQDLLQQLLRKWKAEVDFASTGENVLRALKIKPYQLLLLDIHMPVLNGFDVVRQIRSNFHPGVKDIPILALTADVLPATRDRMISSGINDYVYKPIDANILHSKIHDMLGLTAIIPVYTSDSPDWEISTQFFSLEYLTKNYGYDKNYILSSLNKSSCKLNEYNNAMLTAFREKDFQELLFYTHRLKGIAGVLGIHTIRKQLINIDYLVEAKQHDDRILTEIEAIDQNTKMAYKEITKVIEHISKTIIV